jgi:transposase
MKKINYRRLLEAAARRRERIRMLAQTMSRRDVARKFNISEARVSQIINSMEVK